MSKFDKRLNKPMTLVCAYNMQTAEESSSYTRQHYVSCKDLALSKGNHFNKKNEQRQCVNQILSRRLEGFENRYLTSTVLKIVQRTVPLANVGGSAEKMIFSLVDGFARKGFTNANSAPDWF